MTAPGKAGPGGGGAGTGPTGPAGPGPDDNRPPTKNTGPRDAVASVSTTGVSVPAGAGAGPSLHDLLVELDSTIGYGIRTTSAQWDPNTGPRQQDPCEPDLIDRKLAEVRADLVSARRALDELRRNLPAVTPGRPSPGQVTEDAAAGPAVVAEALPAMPPACAGSAVPVLRSPAVSRKGRAGVTPPGAGFSTGTAPIAASFTVPQRKPWRIT